MKPMLRIAVITGVLALTAAPAFASAANPHEGEPPYGNGPHYTPGDPGNSGDTTPGPKAGLPAQAKAYGRYCNEQNASKKHVKGEQGTEFSRCVKSMAKAANEGKTNPSKACKGNEQETRQRREGDRVLALCESSGEAAERPRSRSPLTGDSPVADDRALPEEHGRLAGGDSVE